MRTRNIPDVYRRQGTCQVRWITVKADRERVFGICRNVLRSVSQFVIVEEDARKGRLLARERFNPFDFGDRMQVITHELPATSTVRVIVSNKPSREGPLISYMGYGTCFRRVEAFVQELRSNPDIEVVSVNPPEVSREEALRDVNVGELMIQDFAHVSGKTTVSDLVHDCVLPTGRQHFLVTDGRGVAIGVLTLLQVEEIAQELWQSTALREIMTPLSAVRWAQISDDAISILESMEKQDVDHLPVTNGARVVGIIGRDAILRFVETQTELIRKGSSPGLQA